MLSDFRLPLILLTGVILSFCSCTTTSDNQNDKDNNVRRQLPHFSNIVSVTQFGDSLRLEVEKRGDTIIRHYIDLRWLSGKEDNFDDSYTVTSAYERTPADTMIKDKGSNVHAKALLTESYKTEFSGGKNLYAITDKGDTISLKHTTLYMK